MATRLTDAAVRAMEAPDKGNRIVYDKDIPGFGLRTTAAGAKAFVLRYRPHGASQRTATIGAWPAWTASAARERAKALRREVDVGRDPLAERRKRRASVHEMQAAVLSERKRRAARTRVSGAGSMTEAERDLLIVAAQLLNHIAFDQAQPLRHALERVINEQIPVTIDPPGAPVTVEVSETPPTPKSVWQGSFTVFGVELRCHVLDDGQRIVEADDMDRLVMAMMGRAESATPWQQADLGDLDAFRAWQKGEG